MSQPLEGGGPMATNWDTGEILRHLVNHEDPWLNFEPGEYSRDEVKARFFNTGVPAGVSFDAVDWDVVTDAINAGT